VSTDNLQSDNSITPVFGLTKAQLQPIVENAVGEPVASFDISVEHQVQGYYGYSSEKVIPTFVYTTRPGRTGNITIFVKRFNEPGPREAHHYAYLEKHRAPIPRMYGSLTDAEQREMIFLEYLDCIGDIEAYRHFLDDADHLHRLLAVIARFSAIRPSDEYAAELPCSDADHISRDLTKAASNLGDIWEHACSGKLGDAMKRLCAGSQKELPRLQTLAHDLIAPTARIERGLTHGDLCVDSVAWRPDPRQLLILDLESINLGPRFYDVAEYIGAPDDVQPRCRPRRELAQYYLDEYARWGGSPVTMDQFLEEMRAQWLRGLLTMVWFPFHRALDGRVDWTEDRQEARQACRRQLYEEVSALLTQVR